MTDTMQTKKLFFAMGTVNSVTVFEPADEALSAIKDRVLDACIPVMLPQRSRETAADSRRVLKAYVRFICNSKPPCFHRLYIVCRNMYIITLSH